MIKIGIIGGSGLENIAGVECLGEKAVSTKYGEPSSAYRLFQLGDCCFYVLSRHGDSHNIAPHNVNYKANIAGFKSLGVERIVTFSSVGGINKDYSSGDIVLADNAIDFTGRSVSFYESDPLAHVDMTEPFCDKLRGFIKQAAVKEGVSIIDGGVYVCTSGPRFETRAEIKMFGLMGADVVGMTLFPEVTLAREAEICYATVAIVTNSAAGIVKTHKLTSEEVVENGEMAVLNVIKILSGLAAIITEGRDCQCKDALKGAIINK